MESTPTPDSRPDTSLCRAMARETSSLMAPLRVVLRDAPDVPLRVCVLTGFFLNYNDEVYWITAGHVAESLHKLHHEHPERIVHSSFCQFPANNFLINDDSHTFIYINDEHVDIGFFKLRPLYAAMIKADPKTTLIDARIWMPSSTSESNCDYWLLVGTPHSWCKFEVTSELQGKFKSKLGIPNVVVPVEPIDDLGASANCPGSEFWGYDTCLYGHVGNAVGPQEQSLNDIGGMSGGLLLAATLEDDGVRYQAIGLQSAWLPNSRIIKANRILLLKCAIDRFNEDPELIIELMKQRLPSQ